VLARNNDIVLTLFTEYIGQLEGEVAMKAQEGSDLRQENQALMQENERYRGLIETLLRHPAFTPFINDISKDPSVLGLPAQQPKQQQQQMQQPQPQPTPSQQPAQPQQLSSLDQDIKPDFMNFDASQLQLPNQQQQQQQQQDQQQIGLAMIPEENFSKLNLNGFQRPMNFNDYNSVNAYAVTDLPWCDPVELLNDSPANLPITANAFSTSAASTADYSAYSPDMTLLLTRLDGAARKLGTA